MPREIQARDVAAALPQLLREAGSGPVSILDGDETLAVLLSGPEYESLVQQRGRRALEALRRLQETMDGSGASQAELEELELALNRKAS